MAAPAATGPVFAALVFAALAFTALVFTALVLAALARAVLAAFASLDFALEAAVFAAPVRAAPFFAAVRARADAVRAEAALFVDAAFVAPRLALAAELLLVLFVLLVLFLAEAGCLALAALEDERVAAACAVLARVSPVAPRFLLEADASRLFAVFLLEGIRGYSLSLSRFGDGTEASWPGTTLRPGHDGAMDRAQIG